MITKLENGRIYDPINKINGKIKDLFIKNGKIIDRPKRNEKISKIINFKKKIIQNFFSLFGMKNFRMKLQTKYFIFFN